jgi:hypothetical protein
MRSLLTLLLASTLSGADSWTDTFTIDKIAIPPGIDPQIGGLDTMPNGNLAMCFHRGEVLIYNPESETWTHFAEGLHEPLGILAESNSSFLIMQRPELTRVKDTDGDGVADLYETVFDGFGMTGNYHEFAFGPARDKDGNLYVSLNVASNGAGVRAEVRGPWSDIGLDRANMLNGSGWGKFRGKAGRMYSRVAYRGWVLKLSPDGKEFQPFASGFRSPEGLGFDREGRLLVTDNQGDWLGTSKLHHVRKGHFHGHPASLVWNKGWTRDPLKVPVPQLDEMRTPAMALLPQGELANSPTEPRMIPQGVFGPLSEQMLIGEMNQSNLVRFLPDPVGEVSQGAAIPFLRTNALGRGNHRLTFTEDGSLWIGKTHLSWAGSNGLVRIRLKENQEDFLAVEGINLIDCGFHLSFTQAIDRKTLQSVKLRRHTYKYHQAYGSPKIDEKEVACEITEISKNDKSCVVKFDDLKEGYLYTVSLPGVTSVKGKPLLGNKIYYTLLKKR